MKAIAPSWTELLGRMAAVSFRSATGKVTWKYTNDQGEVSEGSITFWFRRSGDMRIDSNVGTVMLRTNGSTLTRDRSGKMQRHEGSVSWGGHGSPYEMLGGRDVAENLSNPNHYSTPVGPGSASEIDGRPGWEFTLEPPQHKSYDLRVVIDDATAAVLEMRSVGIDNYTTLTDFEPDADIDDTIFVYDGPIATDHLERREHDRQVAQMQREVKWPTPRYWPTGMEIHLDDATPTPEHSSECWKTEPARSLPDGLKVILILRTSSAIGLTSTCIDGQPTVSNGLWRLNRRLAKKT